MSVDGAREAYAAWVKAFDIGICPRRPACSTCNWIEQEIDAASIDLDLAVAEASRQRARESVAW